MSQDLLYDELVESYYENLHTTLRNFRPGPEYLEGWVHDENHNRSIIGIFEAAEDSGIDQLTLKVSSTKSHLLDKPWLKENLADFGKVTFEETSADLKIHVDFKMSGTAFSVHPAYEKSLDTASRAIRHEGTLRTDILATDQGVTLSFNVDSNGVIQDAKHSGAQGVQRPLLDQFCGLLNGVPMQEAAEHSVIKLEKNLRSTSVPPPIPGLVTPENADPIFAVPTKLIRMAFAQYLKVRGAKREWNDWERPLNRAWQTLTPEAQIEKINQTLQQICRELSLSYEKLQILEIKGGRRVVLSGVNYSLKPSFGHDLMVLERELKQRLEPGLELILESLEDRNQREGRTQRENTFGASAGKEDGVKS